MSFSSRLKEKQEKERERQGKEREQGIVRSGESSSQKPVNAFLERRQARQREQDAQMAQAVQADHSMEKTDFFRADREQAAKDYAKQNAKQRLSRFQSDFYGNLSPNTYMDSASSEELSALKKAEKNRGKLADMAEEYAKIRTNRPNNTVITNNLDTAGSEDLSAWAKQAKEANKKAYQNQKAMDQIGFRDEAGTFHRYDSLERQEPDFIEMVGAGKEKDNIFDPTASYGPLDYLNKDKRAVIRGSQYNFTKMTDAEKNLYYYLNGKYGPQAATNYIKTLGPELNRRNVEDVQESASSLAKEHPVLGVGLDAGIAMAGSGAYPVLLAEQAYNNMMGRYDDIDPNDPLFGSPILGEGIRTGITNNEALSRAIPNEGLRNFLVGTGLSMTENLARLPLGYYGLGAAAGGSGLSGTREAVQRGGDNGQAITLGIANAAAEAFFEKFSLEGLESMKVAPGKGVREFLKNVGKQAVTEGSEEVFTEIANSISDRAIMGELSQYHLAYENYKAQGMDEKTAKQQAFLDFMKNVGEAGLGGALSGGVMGAGGQALGKMQESHALNQYGKGLDVDYRDYVNGFSGIQQESYADPADYQEAVDLQQIAQEYADRQKNKETISNRDKAEYDLRFRQFAENTLRHNEEKTAQETNQNDQQTEETQQAEQTYTEPTKAEYEPYSEPETAWDYTQDAAEEGPEPAAPQNQPTPKQETTQEAAYTPTETSPQDQTKAYRKPYGQNGQKALEKGYDGSIELSTYNKAFGRAYDAGYYNVDIDIAERSAIRSVIGNDQFLEAYKAGAQDHNLESRTTNMVQGAPKAGGLGTVSENATTAQRKVAEHIGKATGLKINLVDGMDQSNATGSYRNGEITLSINSSDFNGSLTHELTHHIKEYSPKGYRRYTEIAVEALMKSEDTSLENLVERYTNQYADAGQELTREEVMEEIVADATQKFFNDSEFINSIVKKDKTIAQRITDFLSDVIDSLKQLIKNGSTRAAAKGLEEDLGYYEDARDAWMQALADAGETYKSGMETQKEGQKERNALEKPDQVTEKNIEENYTKVRGMEYVTEMEGTEFGKGEKKLSEQILEFFESIGGKAHNEVVGDVILNKRAIKDDMAHGISRKKAVAFAAIPDVIEKGHVLDHQKNWKGRGYDSAVIGAKVKIAGEEYYELVIVKLKDENHLYVHEVHTAKVGEDSVLDQLFPNAESSNGTSGGNPLPIYSIFDKLINVNGKTKDNQSENIRFQLEDVDDTVTDRRIEALLYENQTLRDANALLEKQFELTPQSAVRKQDVEKVAKGLLKEYNSKYKPDTLVKNLDKLYGYIRSAEHVNSTELTEAATSIAKSILNQSEHLDTELTQQYKDVRKQIKDTKITLSEQDKADMEASGGYNEFRKRNFGRMKLGNDGISVDTLYQELSGQYPELFPADITRPADQLVAIADALDQTNAQVRNPYSANMDEMAYIVGQDILQAYFDVRQERPTFADRKEAEIQKVKREYSQKMREYKNDLKRKYEENLHRIKEENTQEIQRLAKSYRNLTEAQKNEQREYYQKKMDDLRNEKNQAMAAMQQKNREQARKVRENQRAREAKKIIMKEAKTMQNWLLKPTDAKHIPEETRVAVAEFLSNIDFSSNELNNNGIPTQRTMAWMKAKDEFAKIIEGGGILRGKDGSELYMEIDPDLVSRIEAIVEKAKGMDKLDNLDAYHMEELKKVVVSMKKAITEANTLKSNKRSGQLSILAERIFNDLEDRKNRPEYLGLIGPADKLLNYDMLDPQTMFGLLGDDFKSLYDALREGLNHKTTKLKAAQDYIEETLKKNHISYKQIREWTGPDAKTSRYQTSGGTIDLTISQVMSLYELNKRNQAKTHLYERTGGIIPAPRAGKLRIEDGKMILPKTEKAYRETKVRPEDVERIINTLTPEQKALADSMQRFMGDECAAWGNEVSMQMYGYMKYTARNYFPITVYDNHIRTKQGDLKNQQRTIKNLGFTKSTVEKANKPIVIEDIFDVYSRQVDQMSTYNAYVVPLSDLNKVFNYMDMKDAAEGKSIKQEIERTHGKAGNKYIDKLIGDINGSLNTDRNIWDKLSQNMKVASVGANLRVALQQPTAYIRAGMEMDPKYLGRGALTMTRKDQWDHMCRYAPITQWKDWGFYRMDNSRQMKDVMFQTDSAMQRINNISMTLAEKGDKFAWNRLWRACEFECMDKHPELKTGTDGFYTEVGRRFSEIIDKTQVVDSVLHRTQIMRSERDSDKMLTAFMAEPLKSYNMLYRAASDVAMGKQGAKGRMAKAVTIYTASAFATAVAAAIQDAMRDDDRDKKWIEKYLTAVTGNFADNMNMINNIPYVKDVYGVFLGGYTPNRPDVAAYQDLAYALNRVRKLAKGESKLTPQAVVLDVIQNTSKLIGSPVKSGTRDIRAIVDTAINEFGSKSADYAWLKQKYAIGSKENLNLYVGMMIEAQRNGDKDLEKRIKTDLNKAEIDNETISTKIKSLIKGELISKDHVDPRIEEAAKARMAADTESYKAAVSELIAEGYAGKLVSSAVDTRINQLSGEEEIDWEEEAATDPDELYGEILTGEAEEEDWDIYSSADILKAVDQVGTTMESAKAFKKITTEIVDTKVKAGKTKDDAIGDIKSSISRRYKQEWIEAYLAKDQEGYEAIMAKLNRLTVDGKNLYTGKDYTKWRKEAKEKEKEGKK